VAGAGAFAVACAGSRQDAAPAAPAPAPATVEVWHPWDGTREPLFNQMVDDFHTLHPSVTVHPLIVLATVHNERFLAASAAGTPPAVPNPGNAELPDLVVRKYLEPLDDAMKREKVPATDFYDGDIKASSFLNRVYFLPAFAGTGRRMLFRNKQHFQAAGLDPNKSPVTWDELEQTERALTVRQGGELQRPGFWGESYRRWLVAAGGKWVSDDGRKVLFNTGPAVTVLEWMKRRSDSIYGSYADRAAFVKPRSSAASRNGFYTQELSMTIEGPWVFYEADTSAPGLQYGASLSPVQKAGFPPSMVEAIAGYAVSAGIKETQQAFALVKYLSWDDRGGGKFMLQQKRPSPVKRHNDNPDMKQLNPQWDVALAAMKADTWFANSGADAQINALIGTMTDDVMAGKTSAQAALQDAATAGQMEIDKFWARVPAGSK
jgi:multiple sugar transport system substrate-binding protein